MLHVTQQNRNNNKNTSIWDNWFDKQIPPEAFLYSTNYELYLDVSSIYKTCTKHFPLFQPTRILKLLQSQPRAFTSDTCVVLWQHDSYFTFFGFVRRVCRSWPWGSGRANRSSWRSASRPRPWMVRWTGGHFVPNPVPGLCAWQMPTWMGCSKGWPGNHCR